MWNPAGEVMSSSKVQQRRHAHTDTPTGGGDCHCSSTPLDDDFSHILKAAHISFGNGNAGNSSSITAGTISEQPSSIIDRVTQGLLSSSMGCVRCAQINGIRESLKSVEASYLGEIAQLRQMVAQMDGERVDAVNSVEETLLTVDKSRQQGLSKDREIQSLSGQLRSMEDKHERLEFELTSLRQRYRRDIVFYNQREIIFFMENERYARASLLSSEAGWWSTLQTEHLSVVEMNRRKCLFSSAHSCDASITTQERERRLETSDNNNNNSNSSGSTRGRSGGCVPPSHSAAGALPLSITRWAGKEQGESGGGVKHDVKGGLLTELWQSKKSVDELNEKLKRDLNKKEEQIALLQEKLSIQEENFARLSQEVIDEDNLTGEMQEEIDDMLRTEVMLTQMSERHQLETEAVEERVKMLQFLLQQWSNYYYHYGQQNQIEQPELVSVTKKQHTKRLDGTPEKQRLATLLRTPGTSPHFLRDQNGVEADTNHRGSRLQPLCREQTDEFYTSLSSVVSKTVQSVLHDNLLPLKLSVESIRATSDELCANVKKVSEAISQDGDNQSVSGKQEIFLGDVQRMLQEFSAAKTPEGVPGLTSLRDTLKKMARMTSHNAKIMDDKLNDILISQSAMTRQLTLLTFPSIEKHMNEVMPSVSFTAVPPVGGVDESAADRNGKNSSDIKRVHFELPDSETTSSPAEKNGARTTLNSVTLPTHTWDVADSDDESIPTPYISSFVRKTPYDVDDF